MSKYDSGIGDLIVEIVIAIACAAIVVGFAFGEGWI